MEKIKVGFDKRWHMREWLRLDTPIDYSFKEYMIDEKQWYLEAMKVEWKKHGFELNDDDVEFYY